MSNKFFSWFEAKEEEPAIKVTLKKATAEESKTFRMSRIKFYAVVLPIFVLISLIIALNISTFLVLLGALVLTIVLAATGTLFYTAVVETADAPTTSEPAAHSDSTEQAGHEPAPAKAKEETASVAGDSATV